MKVKVKLIDGGIMPKKAHDDDACFDCHSKVFALVPPHFRVKIPLGFALELPSGWEAVVRPRSGLTSKGIDNGIGTIDANYRGEVCAIVINNSDKAFEIKSGDRICQIAIREAPVIELEEVEELSETERGSNGFGSTGV